MGRSAAANDEWQPMLCALRRFREREGHSRVAWAHEEHGVRLGVWLSQQWADQRAGRLSRARQTQLAGAGVVWDGAPPPVRSAVSDECHNERKWDAERAAVLAERNARRDESIGRAVRDVRAFDEQVRIWERHWRPYSAACDVHTAPWRRRTVLRTMRNDGRTAEDHLRVLWTKRKQDQSEQDRPTVSWGKTMHSFAGTLRTS
ncbi:hypothetical protein AB1Y20_014099 [Prymnesium parvum]|uniref:Helicase-associated domain-containing protein n=1 Tax=Prymnesium parvum TaxID=97485 RepID=A0AB34IHW7_PRYPA